MNLLLLKFILNKGEENERKNNRRIKKSIIDK